MASETPPRTGSENRELAWLTIQEAAALLRVKVSWLYDRTRRNAVPHTKLGKYLRFDADELSAWARAFHHDGQGHAALRAKAGRL